MKEQRVTDARIDFHWRADREQGFERASLIYDKNGRLRAVDYEPLRPRRPEPAAPRAS